MACRAVGGCEPHGLTLGEHSQSGPIRATHADVGPVVPWIHRCVAVLKDQPLTIGRPAGSEIQMTGLGGDLHPVAPVGVASPDLVAFATGQMEGHAPTVWAEAVTVGQSFVRAGELAGIRTVQTHVEGLPGPGADHLHEDAPVLKHQLRRIERREAIPGGQFLQVFLIEIVGPNVGGCLVVVFVEGSARTVPPRLHAQQEHPPVFQETGRLPRHLTGGRNFQLMNVLARRVDDTSLARRGEEQALWPVATHRHQGASRSHGQAAQPRPLQELSSIHGNGRHAGSARLACRESSPHRPSLCLGGQPPILSCWLLRGLGNNVR